MQFDLDIARFLADFREVSAQIKALKSVLGTRWQEPMAERQRELRRLEQRATELAALRAFSRGKLHFRRLPPDAPLGCDIPEYHRLIVDRLGPTYAVRFEEYA
jgi:hypothetical protein